MNEVNQIIIFIKENKDIFNTKLSKNFLQKYEKKVKLYRLINQAKSNGIKKVLLVGNIKLKKKFKGITIEITNDHDIKSILTHIDGAFVSFDSNMLLENDLAKYVLGSDFEDKSILFTNDRPNNVVIKSDKKGFVTDIKVDDGNINSYAYYTNIIRISNKDLEPFKKIIKDNQYNLLSLEEEYIKFKFEEANINNFYISKEKYKKFLKRKVDFKEMKCDTELVDISIIKPIEEYGDERVSKLIEKIEKENKWTVPLIIEKENHMILDGHHRFESAKRMGLKRVPAILVDYKDVAVWSLRKEIEISVENVRNYVLDGNIYPYKTVKHKYKFIIPNINIELDDLK